MLVQGSGFNFPDQQHFRIVFLPHEADLREAIERLAQFLANWRVRHGAAKA
jgi:alanine-synthesizing transaminase